MSPSPPPPSPRIKKEPSHDDVFTRERSVDSHERKRERNGTGEVEGEEEEEESHRGISLGSRWPPRGYNLVPSSSKPVLPWSIKRTQVHLAKGKAEIIIGWCRVERIKVGSRFSSGRKRGRSVLGKGILRVGIGVRVRVCVCCGLRKEGQRNFMGEGEDWRWNR